MNAPVFRLIAPPHTPFASDYSLDLDVVECQANWLLEQGVDGVFVAGSTGEGQSLTVRERELLAERWIDVAGQTDLEVIVQVGHNSQTDAIRLAAHAERIGADSIAASSPSYFKPGTADDLIDFMVPVAAAAGDLPFYFYDIPSLTHVRLPMTEFLERGKSRIPNLFGLKYTNDDLWQLQECVGLLDGEFEILYGSDQTLLAGFVLGACGAVGTTYNFAAPLYRKILALAAGGDLLGARSEQAQAARMIRVIAGYGGVSAFKAVMAMVGIDCGPVRPPLRDLTAGERKSLQRELAALGVIDFPKLSPKRRRPTKKLERKSAVRLVDELAGS